MVWLFYSNFAVDNPVKGMINNLKTYYFMKKLFLKLLCAVRALRLAEAHAKLDDIVESCYPGYPFVSDEARLECLFKLYEKMTAEKK